MDGGGRGKLLLVEDEDLLRRLVAEFLRAEGFEVVEAADGLQGVNLFAGRGPFDLVVLDLNLPALSGIDVCRRIKSQQPLQRVLICSAAILEHHIAALRALDVDQFLTKPYHPLELLERIARAMGRVRHDEDQGQGRGSGSPRAIWRVDVPSRCPPRRPYSGQATAIGLG